MVAARTDGLHLFAAIVHHQVPASVRPDVVAEVHGQVVVGYLAAPRQLHGDVLLSVPKQDGLLVAPARAVEGCIVGIGSGALGSACHKIFHLLVHGLLTLGGADGLTSQVNLAGYLSQQLHRLVGTPEREG